MNAIAGEVLFGDKPGQVAVDAHGRDVKQAPAVHQRQAQAGNQATGPGQDLTEHLPGRTLSARRMEGVFAPVAGNTEFGQADDSHTGSASFVEGGDDVRLVAFPVEWGLVQGRCRDLDQFHGVPAGKRWRRKSLGPILRSLLSSFILRRTQTAGKRPFDCTRNGWAIVDRHFSRSNSIRHDSSLS